MTTRYCVSIAKPWVIAEIRRHGFRKALEHHEQFSSDEQAIDAVRSDTRSFFSGCPTPLPDGRCPGHPVR